MTQLTVQIISLIIFYSMFGFLLFLVRRNGKVEEQRTQRLEQALIDAVQTATETNRKLAEYIMEQTRHE